MGAYDVTTKALIERYPADWVAMAGLPSGSVELIDADLSTVMPVADKLIRVDGPDGPYIAQIDLQSGRDIHLDRRMLMYNVSAGWRHKLPVRSTLFLMQPAAHPREVTGHFRQSDGRFNRLEFDYPIIRVWELSADTFLTAGIGTLPLAPLSAVEPSELPGVVRRMRDRLDVEVESAHGGRVVDRDGHPHGDTV